MNHEDMILGCERVARDLLYNGQPHAKKAVESDFVDSREFRFAVQEHLAYTEMVIERHLAGVPMNRRDAERARIGRFTPTIRELRRRFLVTHGAS